MYLDWIGYLVGLVIPLGFHPTLPHPSESVPQQPFNFTAFNFPCPPQTLVLAKKISTFCCFFHHCLKLFVATTQNSLPFPGIPCPISLPSLCIWSFLCLKSSFYHLFLHQANTLSSINTQLKCHPCEAWCSRLLPSGLPWYSVFYYNICPIIVSCTFHVYFVN